MTDAATDWQRFKQALAPEGLPAAFLDLDAFEHNFELLTQAMGDTRLGLRVASKSVRVPWVLASWE